LSPSCLVGHTSVCARSLVVGDGARLDDVDVEIRPLAAMPAPARVAAPGNGTGFGVLRVLDGGYHALETAGTPWQRGWAHGYLLAAQILDFFEFFVLEDRVRGAPAAIKSRYPAIRDALERRIALSPTAERKVRGMLAGMAASGANLITSVGAFGYGDLLAINNYNDFSRILELDGRPARREREDSCTQFVFFGDLTGGEGTIAGRNMDGENDVRKVTVRSLVLFADAGAKRVVHAMWPAEQEKGAKFPTSKAPISAVFHSFRLIFGRAIISRNGLEAWMLFPERARAEHSC